MGKINWSRVFVGGLVAGIVTFVIGGLITAIWAKELEAGITALGHPYAIPKSPGTLLSVFLVNLVLGLVLVWLYAGIRPRYGPGPKTAAAGGVAIWLIMAMSDVFFITIGVLPVRPFVAPIAAGLVATLAAAEVGAWLYKE